MIHRHKPTDGCNLSLISPTGVPVTVATAKLCRCGAVLSRELTPAGEQQEEEWGRPAEEMLRMLDSTIVAHLSRKAE